MEEGALAGFYGIRKQNQELLILSPSQNIPSDKELLEVATEITKILKDNWIILQASLSIPDHIMLDVLSQTTMNQQIFR